MNDYSPRSEKTVEVVAPDRSRQHVPLKTFPFLIGRGSGGAVALLAMRYLTPGAQ